MTQTNFSGCKVLVVGGAGFVGSNLVHQILQHDVNKIIVVDNLLSSDVSNIPADPRVEFVFGSITDDRILHKLPEDLDYAFHLACFHGNQSSIADPFADHDNNTYTSLKLFDRLKDIKHLKKVVYAAAACAVAEKTYDAPTATTEDQPVTLYHDSPYSISKIIGELYGNYYFQQHKLPFFQVARRHFLLFENFRQLRHEPRNRAIVAGSPLDHSVPFLMLAGFGCNFFRTSCSLHDPSG